MACHWAQIRINIHLENNKLEPKNLLHFSAGNLICIVGCVCVCGGVDDIVCVCVCVCRGAPMQFCTRRDVTV